MYTRTIVAGHKLLWSLLFWLVVQNVFTAAAPTLSSILKRDAAEFLNGVSTRFQNAIPVATQAGIDLLNTVFGTVGGGRSMYTIPQQASVTASIARSASILTVRTNFLYGSPVGGGPYYPSGLLGVAKDAADAASIQIDLNSQIFNAATDLAQAVLDSQKYNGLKTLDDYNQLYRDEWVHSLPSGTNPGVETNYTQDLFFSMQRLSNSPYQVHRLNPASDTLPFVLDDAIATFITTTTLQSLFQQNRLFYADYRDQANLTLNPGHYSAACDAYFYISPLTSEFLPLAIRTNTPPSQGQPATSLIYTPLDSPGDWLLAKLAFNANDFWFSQWNHLAFTHETVQIIWMAAIRTLSADHPVFAILSRLSHQVFAIQILAKAVLFAPGGAVDLVFAYSGRDAEEHTTRMYKNGAGRFRGNGFEEDVWRRGLVGVEPRLKHFPFYEDAGAIHGPIRGFMVELVGSYYKGDGDVADDNEIQAWVAEANGPAGVMDFPGRVTTREGLVEVLTQVAHLVSAAHHTVNTNELLQVSSTLPFCPPALYKPLPTQKSPTTNPAEWLPPLSKVMEQLVIGALFARPELVGTNRTILHMFNDQDMLSRMNPATRAANDVFMSAMRNVSSQVAGRRFGADGLSQGMPTVWRALDPNVAPFSVST